MCAVNLCSIWWFDTKCIVVPVEVGFLQNPSRRLLLSLKTENTDSLCFLFHYILFCIRLNHIIHYRFGISMDIIIDCT